MLSNLLVMMGARRNFRRGGASPNKKALPWSKKVAKWPPHGEKAPKNEKNVAKMPPYEEKVAKNFFFFRGGGGGGRPISCWRPCLQSRGFNNHYILYKKWILIQKLKAKLYQIHYKLHPLKNIISGQWTMFLDPLASTWLQFIIIIV